MQSELINKAVAALICERDVLATEQKLLADKIDAINRAVALIGGGAEVAAVERRDRRMKIDEGRYRELHADGKNDHEIARTLNCSVGGAHKLRYRLGLPANDKRGGDRRFSGHAEPAPQVAAE